MKFLSVRFGLARSLVALVVSFALVLSTTLLAFASVSKSAATVKETSAQPSPDGLQLTASASATATGVLIQWRTNSTPDNLGFNIYRLKDGQRTRVNREIIAGALFGPGTPAMMRAGYSYSWFDRGGTADSTYFIESVNADGDAKSHDGITPVVSRTVSEFDQAASGGGDASAAASTNTFVKNYPAAESPQLNLPHTIQDQWGIAAQQALKIGIKKDGWHRVTQQQMVAAGFNPTVDIRNLRLFVDANEVAILTNQLTGAFGSGDFIEFYGRGLDTPVTDTRIYYLIAGTTPGKRVTGEIQLDTPPIDPPPIDPPILPPVVAPGPTAPPPASVTPSVTVAPSTVPVLRDPIFSSWVLRGLGVWSDSLASTSSSVSREPRGPDSRRQEQEADGVRQEQEAGAGGRMNSKSVADFVPNDLVAANNTTPKAKKLVAGTPEAKKLVASTPVFVSNTPSARSPVVPRAARKSRKSKFSKKRKGRKLRRKSQPERHHALLGDSFAPTSFEHTFQIKTRGLYLSNLINGDDENWFGQVIGSPNLTLAASNLDPSALAPARLEFALQGVSNQQGTDHHILVALNGTNIDNFTFGALDHPVRQISIPIAQLLNGDNALTFTKTSPGVSLIDYVRLTYPHKFKADAGSLRFNLLDTQTLSVDGFSTPSIRLIDYTDPLAVALSKPASEPTASGYAITVPRADIRTKSQRLFYAIPDGQFEQAASLLLSEPSTLNLSSNAADYLIISHKTFLGSVEALRVARNVPGMTAKVVEVEDVYDEFSYGLHGPQGIKDFLQHASTNWATPPRYVVFAGDSSHDPRNYQGSGNFDFVPTKLVDATFNETASDDWLTDFEGDGVGEIPVGRLPFRTVADADRLISRIINFTPVTPQSAMLVADDPTNYYFNFEIANDEVQALLPGTMAVQRVNVRIDGVAAAKTNVIAGFNQGRALVNYTGHGNVDVWASAGIFNANDALALTNGNVNKFSFVVVMDCLNGYFQDPVLLSLSEALLKAPNGGAVAAFASSGLTFPDGQHEMAEELYTLLYGPQPIALGDAIKSAKNATFDIDVRRTWVFFGDPSMKIR